MPSVGQDQPADLSLFSEIGILDFAHWKDTSVTATLVRDDSFPPAIRTNQLEIVRSADKSSLTWLPQAIPTNESCLWVRLGKKLGEGSSGVVYSVELRSPTTSAIPERLCIKIAKPAFTRSIPREAWFYERLALEKLDGIVSPRCFGFFSMPRRLLDFDGVRSDFLPWEDEDVPSDLERRELPDDPSAVFKRFFYEGEDLRGRLESQWLRPDSCKYGRHIVILLLERMADDFDPASGNHAGIEDMKEVLQDLTSLGIQHTDIRYNNFMRPSRGSPQVTCPRHGRPHSWKILDLEHARRWLVTDNPKDLRALERQIGEVGFDQPYFVGAVHRGD